MNVAHSTALEGPSRHRGVLPPDASTAYEPYIVAIRPVRALRPSECVDQRRVIELADTIRREGRWTQPLPIHAGSGVVMDGNHRLRVAQLLGLTRLPCVPLAYDDPRVAVACWRTGGPFEWSRLAQVIDQQVLLPLKTTRHRFTPCLPRTEIPLELLA